MNNNDKNSKSKKKKIKVIDLRKLTDPDNDVYICEQDNVRLIPYHDTEGKYLTRGKLFQCGRCGQIKDTERADLQRPETLIARGDTNQNFFFKNWRQESTTKPKQFDIEPGDDLQLQAQGFHITRTRITSGDGKILRDDNQYTAAYSTNKTRSRM